MILPAQTIRRLKPVEPMVERSVAFGMSYGIGPCGYDVRVAEDLLLWPGRFTLASTIEHFMMPNDVEGEVKDKSSWARLGISVFNTMIDPGWAGWLTLEIKNASWSWVRLRAGMPIAQILFKRLEEPTEIPYAGKYQDQARGPQPARFELAA